MIVVTVVTVVKVVRVVTVVTVVTKQLVSSKNILYRELYFLLNKKNTQNNFFHKKTSIVMKLKNSKCDETQKLKV